MTSYSLCFAFFVCTRSKISAGDIEYRIILYSMDNQLEDLVTSIHGLLEHRAVTHADRPAIIQGDKTLTFSELFADINAHSRQLKALGVQRGSRVGIHLRKSTEEVVATLAIASLGAIFVNINYQWTEIQIRHVVADCGIRLLITDAIKMQTLEPWLEEKPFDHILVVEGKNISERIAAWSDIPPAIYASRYF